MNTRQELLSMIEQLPEEQLNPLLNLAHSLQQSQPSQSQKPLSLRDFLKLPPQERDRLLAQQLDPTTANGQAIADYFQPGSEGMEWTEEYTEDENWDDE
jgi:gentisate 1,2-dioxygenase